MERLLSDGDLNELLNQLENDNVRFILKACLDLSIAFKALQARVVQMEERVERQEIMIMSQGLLPLE